MNTQADHSQECCPEFNPSIWDDKTIEWNNKRFIKEKVCTFFYMPMNFGKVMIRANSKVDKAGAVFQDGLCLSDHTSKWNMDLFLAVDKEVANANNTTMSGKFYCKVYEGPFKDSGKWCRDFEGVMKAKGFKMGKMLMWYTTCPKCAKKYGKNYVVILGKVE